MSSTNIVSSDLPDVVIPSGQITSFIAQKTAQFAGAVAMEDGITGRTYTYDELLDKVRSLHEKLCLPLLEPVSRAGSGTRLGKKK